MLVCLMLVCGVRCCRHFGEVLQGQGGVTAFCRRRAGCCAGEGSQRGEEGEGGESRITPQGDEGQHRGGRLELRCQAVYQE